VFFRVGTQRNGLGWCLADRDARIVLFVLDDPGFFVVRVKDFSVASVLALVSPAAQSHQLPRIFRTRCGPKKGTGAI